MALKTTIVQSAAVDLLQRLTETLEIPFTLTDRDGTVIASTAGRPSGQVDAYAYAVAREGLPLDITEEQLQVSEPAMLYSPLAAHAGLLPPAPGIYVPVRMDQTIAAVLFARGEPDDVRTKAMTAAAAAGLTLEFAGGASDSIQRTLAPDLAMRALLRGSQGQSRRAAVLIKVAGWNLLAPRTALVITPAHPDERLPEATHAVVRELLNALFPNTPSAQLGHSEIVALPALPTSESQPSIETAARDIQQQLADQGLAVVIGVGEMHIDMPVLPGLRRSYREALFAAQWGVRSGVSANVHSLRSLGPVAFLAPGLRGRQKFARELLEPLRKTPEILETVRAFLNADLSLEATAKLSGQHRHTVRTHLIRARELSGLDPRVLMDALQLKLALLIEREPVQSV
jgi:sugar diacid utilization regulator